MVSEKKTKTPFKRGQMKLRFDMPSVRSLSKTPFKRGQMKPCLDLPSARSFSKAASLIIAAVILLGSFIYVPDWSVIGVAKGCTFVPRIGYSFFHVSFIHALVNAWCLLSIVFIYDISIWRLLTAYIVAVCVPEFLLSDVPTVGMSCVCYTLLGSLIFEVKRKLYFLSCMALYIAPGFFFSGVNAFIHIYGYLAGLIVGLLNTPLSCFKR